MKFRIDEITLNGTKSFTPQLVLTFNPNLAVGEIFFFPISCNAFQHPTRSLRAYQNRGGFIEGGKTIYSANLRLQYLTKP